MSPNFLLISKRVTIKSVRRSTLSDYADWLDLAKEVEPLFGPMVDDMAFREGLKQAIMEKRALCVSELQENGRRVCQGGIVISQPANEILWLAVSQKSRGRGIGMALLTEAIACLDRNRPITVTTFDQTIKAGLPARRLYHLLGFRDSMTAGLNPAGISTVTMTLIRQNPVA